jgi:hypothetical protein
MVKLILALESVMKVKKLSSSGLLMEDLALYLLAEVFTFGDKA